MLGGLAVWNILIFDAFQLTGLLATIAARPDFAKSATSSNDMNNIDSVIYGDIMYLAWPLVADLCLLAERRTRTMTMISSAGGLSETTGMLT